MVPDITHIFVQNYMEQYLKNILGMQEITDITLRILLVHMRNNSHHLLMIVAAAVLMHYH